MSICHSIPQEWKQICTVIEIQHLSLVTKYEYLSHFQKVSKIVYNDSVQCEYLVAARFRKLNKIISHQVTYDQYVDAFISHKNVQNCKISEF